MNPQVIVISEAIKEHFNIDGLRKFGDVVYLYTANERKPSVYNANVFAASISTRLSDIGYDSTRDYVAIVGRQVEVGFLFFVLGLLVGDMKALFFDAQKAEYSESEIRADEIPDIRTTRPVRGG